MSIQDLRPDPQDKPTFYLGNIYQLLADTNVSRPSIPSTVAEPPPFSPPRYAIWVNVLWFSSLVISLSSALLATLFQQWSRRYLMLSQPLGDPLKRARHRQFFFGGVDYHVLLATDVVPTLLHLSVFLFFAGLLILLKNINRTVFNGVVVWVVLCVGIYGYFTILPVIYPADLHFSPLASLACQIYTGLRYCVVKFHSRLRSLFRKGIFNSKSPLPDDHGPDDHRTRLLIRLERKAEEIILGKTLELDAGILESLLNDLGEDDARETFFETIPDFYSRRLQMKDSKKLLSLDFVTKFWCSIYQFLDQTLFSDSLSEWARARQLLVCLKATCCVLDEDARNNIAGRIICDGNWNEVPASPKIGHILRGCLNSTKPWIATTGSCIIAQIIAGEGKHDDAWKALTRSQLRKTTEDLQRYNENSVLLDNLIVTISLFFKKRLQFKGILQSISGFNVHDTLPDLQRNFCNLWNEIVQYVQDKHNDSHDCVFILEEIRHLYEALHSTGPITVAEPTYTAENDDYPHPGLGFPLCANPQTHLFPTATYTSVSHQVTSPPTDEPSIVLDISHVSRQISPVAASPSTDNSSSPIPLTPLGEIPVELRGHRPPLMEFSYSTTTSHTLPTPREVSFSDPSATASRQGKGPV